MERSIESLLDRQAGRIRICCDLSEATAFGSALAKVDADGANGKGSHVCRSFWSGESLRGVRGDRLGCES